MDHLKDMGLFVEVARAKSFRQAAETLDMPSSTLSRRISALEQSIGLRLLHRTTRYVDLTEAGQVYFERSARIVDEARLAHEQLADLISKPNGTLRVSLPVDFAITFLAPHMPAFCERYPGISFELDLSPRRVDLVVEPFDLAIRMGELPDSGLIARKLAEVPRYLYASRRYLNERGEPKKPSDLERHDCLLFPKEGKWTLKRGELAREVHVKGKFRLNNVGMMHRLALEGLGVAMLAQESVLHDLDERRLCRVLPDWQAMPIAVHAISETRLLPAKALRFIEYLAECLEQSRRDL
ncbi:MAG: LysR family transcriptional regulator [Candidatus Afipia apatlaquensis]|uniref:LysR family transcriptional regulator n=1 Tax=Candidatus Afipia apatlaquensis TaxID=2712852 RepID=A0A7C9VEQ1_9BRAD|nr:LysR family transcriptional regulator [Candidatus Afipia apatlaquensis]